MVRGEGGGGFDLGKIDVVYHGVGGRLSGKAFDFFEAGGSFATKSEGEGGVGGGGDRVIERQAR